MAVPSAVFITDRKGKPLIFRNYRGSIPTSVTDEFQRVLLENEDEDQKPIIIDKGITFAFVRHNDLFLLAVTKTNADVMLVLNFLYKIVEIFGDYFGGLEQESIRDNFVLIYELLDEMCDFGYPQHTDAKMLKNYICVTEKHKLEISVDSTKGQEITGTVTGQIPWRPLGIKHKKNEVFLDVVEKLNLLVTSNGNVLHSEILGILKMKSYLSGMPELKLGLNDKIVMDRRSSRKRGGGGNNSNNSNSNNSNSTPSSPNSSSSNNNSNNNNNNNNNSNKKNQSRNKTVEMDDIRFHQCVFLNRFENDRSICFIPPDGEFELMTYRLDTQVRPLIWIEAHRDIKSHSRIEYIIKTKSEFKRRSTANNVEIIIPVPIDADSPKFKTGIGNVVYIPELNIIKWNIKQFQGQKEYLMKAHFGLPSINSQDAGGEQDYWHKTPIRVNFEIPYFTVSGIQVRYLKIIERSGYQALPWVRYITQNGDYQIRM